MQTAVFYAGSLYYKSELLGNINNIRTGLRRDLYAVTKQIGSIQAGSETLAAAQGVPIDLPRNRVS